MTVTLELWEPNIGHTRFVQVDKTTVKPGDEVTLQGHLYQVVEVTE